MFRMPDDRLPKKLFFGQAKGSRPGGCPRFSFNDVAMRDCQLHRMTKHAQIALEGQDLPRTYLARHELESVITIIIIISLGAQ